MVKRVKFKKSNKRARANKHVGWNRIVLMLIMPSQSDPVWLYKWPKGQFNLQTCQLLQKRPVQILKAMKKKIVIK